MAHNVAINGLGRTGKSFLRAVLQDPACTNRLVVKAINIGPASPDNLVLFFKYDSTMSTFPGSVELVDNQLIINGNYAITILTEPNPTKLSWKQFGVESVVDSSGKFCSREKARCHLDAGAQRVIISAPADDADIVIVPGINDSAYDPNKHQIISLASCTTNCFAHIIKVLQKLSPITAGIMTTVHAYTNNQHLLDSQSNDPRRARAAALNIIPTSTGAEGAIIQLFPELQGKLCARSLRVPVGTVSLVDFCFTTQQPLSAQNINEAFKQTAATSPYLSYCTEPLVSSDFIEDPHSAIIDSLLTQSTGTMGQIFAWYDNEFGYSSRIKDFLLHNL